nr:PREDICTED: uncharacterized protein LOC105673728 [Linepithema humile]
MLWPEWKDSDLNNEKWEIPKGGLFLDAETVTMPRSLEPDHWIRAKDLKHLTVKPPLAEWKKHRWLKWAISRNVIDPADYFVPIRYLKVISPLEECKKSTASVYEENNIAGNSIPPSEIEQSDKAARKTRSEKTPDVFIAMKEEAAGDVSRWVDFNKIASYVIEVHLFYKLQYFQHSIQVTDNMLKATSENHKAAATKEIKEETRDMNSNSSKFKYKPVYLFCDSLDKKFFLINLCAGSKEKNADLRQKNYLIFEKYNWFFGADQSDQSVTISTIGNKSTVVELEGGRQLLRVCCHLNSGVAIISSDTSFHLGNRTAVQELMIVESDRIGRTSRIISASLCEAYRSFGTKDYPITLKGYYRSYMPSSLHASSKENKNLRMLIHDAFMKEQVRLIKEAFLDEELGNILRSLRIFFLNPNIRLEYDLTTQKISQDYTINEAKRTRFHTSRNDKSFLNNDQAATIIQSFFKMALVKKYKQLHSPDDALHAQARKELLKISDLFDSSLANQLVRNVINNNNSLHDLYPCYADFAHVLNIQELDGVVESIKHEQWFPIVRLVASPKPAETVFAVLELLVDLPRFALRVFSNHNGREITHVMNHVARYEYIPNGYTVLAYGWSEEQRFKELDWTIRAITIKGEPALHQLDEQRPLSFDTKPPKLLVGELVGTYIPNIKNCISRWILRATSESVVSMRLSVSYDFAEIRIKVTDEKGNVLIDEQGGSKILLPVIILKYPAENEDVGATKNEINKNAIEEKNSYYVEAFVLNDSWPLTDIEWTVVNRIKMRSAGNFETQTQFGNEVSLSSDETTMRDSKQNDDQVLESPYWILQVVADAKNAVELRQDKKREQEIALLKESWWSKDSGRSERGKELRDTFLNIHVSKIEPEALVDENEKHSKIIKDKNMTFCLSHARQRRTLKSPEFHHRLLALNLTKYVKGDEIVEQYQIKTKHDDEILRKQHAMNIADSQENYSSYLENLADLTNKQLRRYAKFFRKREENFWKRRASVDRVCERRKVHIKSLTSERAKIKEKKKN